MAAALHGMARHDEADAMARRGLDAFAAVPDTSVILPDLADALRDLAVTRAAAEADVIVASGGVSVGEEDHVKDVVASLGSLDLWRIAIKPGKPFAFGRVADTPFIGLPGNPVSVFVTLLVVARPYLFACQGPRTQRWSR